MPAEQFGASVAHAYNPDKWTFQASPELIKQSNAVKPSALKELKTPITQPIKKA